MYRVRQPLLLRRQVTPIAKLAAKIAVGLTLDEVINPVTGSTYAMFEPALDYVVAKIPRFPLTSLKRVSAVLVLR